MISNGEKSTVAHELTHILEGDYSFSCLGDTPTWLSEGLAMYGEGGPEEASAANFEQNVNADSLLSFRVLSGGFSEDADIADLSYTQSYYMVNYLIQNYGKDKMLQFLDLLSSAGGLDESLQQAYGFDLDGFENEWRDSLGLSALESAVQAATPTPTIIPTIIPIQGGVAGTSNTLAITPTPSSTAADVEITQIPSSSSAAENANKLGSILFWVLIIAGANCLLLLIFFLIFPPQGRPKMSKNKLLSRMRLIFIGLLICILALVSCASIRSSESGVQSAVNAEGPFATATAYATPQQKNNVYSNEEFGISITIPNSDVEATTSEPDSGTFQEYVFTGGAGYGYLYPTGMASGETLQQVAQSAYESQVGSLEEIEVLKDQEISLPNGGTAWDTRFTGYDAENDYSLEVHLLTVINSDRAVTFMVYSLPEYFSYFTAAEKTMVNSIKLFTPTVLGMPRSQVLVFEGGESSNARENDPATTHGSSDYLVFEGLVTYNEQMEVVPALASSWEISEDGTVYTFHLQPDAVFHNGKPVTAQDVVYSWERAADPETDSDTVMTYLSDIVGVKEMHEGSAESISGLKVIDEHTLQVTI